MKTGVKNIAKTKEIRMSFVSLESIPQKRINPSTANPGRQQMRYSDPRKINDITISGMSGSIAARVNLRNECVKKNIGIKSGI